MSVCQSQYVRHEPYLRAQAVLCHQVAEYNLYVVAKEAEGSEITNRRTKMPQEMGCDIHMYVEYKVVYPANTLVELCRRKIQDTMDTFEYDLSVLPQDLVDLIDEEAITYEWKTPFIRERESYEDDEEEESKPPRAAELDIWRNYGLFGVLADVRNYEDFPTVPRDEGIPFDACSEIVQSKITWNGDGHTHSWILASDLLEWSVWDETVTFQRRRTNDTPAPVGTLREEFGNFLETVTKQVEEHASGNAKNLRLIYWFDN